MRSKDLGGKGSEGRSGLLRGAEKHFTDKALRRLREDHLDRVSDILGLEHLARVLARVRRKIGGDRPPGQTALTRMP